MSRMSERWREQWGDNFREDPDCPGLGTYLRCEHCGAGELPNAKLSGPNGPQEKQR